MGLNSFQYVYFRFRETIMTETAKGRVNQCSLCLSEFFAVCALPMSSDLLPFNERTIFLYLPYNEQVIVECCSGMSVLGNFIHVSLVVIQS